ncbi:MAG TPA: chloride channel protein [Acidimicrobiia bacterium]
MGEARDRWHRVLVLAALTGATTGLSVAGFEWITSQVLLDHTERLPHPLLAVVPAVGLIVAALALRWIGRGATPSTSDEYLHVYHDGHLRLDLSQAPGKVAGSIATLGSGGAMGFEGPSIYLGAVAGSWFQRRFSRYFSRDDGKMLLVAGAAAGVAAIFKAPATGALFALEVPYQEDTAAHALLPALVASAVSYLVFVTFHGTTPLFAITGEPRFDATDLLGAIGLGLLAGLGARGFVSLLRAAKGWSARASTVPRIVVGGSGLVAVTVAGLVAFHGVPLTIGPGYRAIQWSLGNRTLLLLLLLFVLHALATASTIAGGGAGGTFIPLVVQGWLLGRVISRAVGSTTSLFPVIGAAAFLGAGYRTPIAAVVFVAEATGRPGFIVPGLVATAIAQLVMGRRSITPYQRPRRPGLLERRFELPVTAALVPDPQFCAPDATIEELIDRHFLTDRSTSVPVLDADEYLGMVVLADAMAVEIDARASTTARQILRTDAATARPTWNLRQTLRAMENAGVDRLTVLDGDRLVGIVTAAEIVRVDEILGPSDA